MKKIVVVCTEKEGERNEAVFKLVLDSISAQKPDEIVVVHNRPVFVSTDGVTNLFFEKTSDYEVASCLNMALDYCEDKYPDDFIILTNNDDCIWHETYIHSMTDNLKHLTVRQPMLAYLNWPLDNEFLEQFTPGSWLHRDVPNLQNAIDRVDEIGQGMQLFGLISLIWSQAMRGLRYDSNFNGNWGLEDTDFSFQLLQRGCSVTHQQRAYAWHVNTGWKPENHQGSHEDRSNNANQNYFKQKWLL